MVVDEWHRNAASSSATADGACHDNSASMQLLCRGVNGNTVTINGVVATTTVAELLEMIGCKTVTPIEEQCLVISGKQPAENATMAECRVEAGTEVRVAARVRGGAGDGEGAARSTSTRFCLSEAYSRLLASMCHRHTDASGDVMWQRVVEDWREHAPPGIYQAGLGALRQRWMNTHVPSRAPQLAPASDRLHVVPVGNLLPRAMGRPIDAPAVAGAQVSGGIAHLPMAEATLFQPLLAISTPAQAAAPCNANATPASAAPAAAVPSAPTPAPLAPTHGASAPVPAACATAAPLAPAAESAPALATSVSPEVETPDAASAPVPAACATAPPAPAVTPARALGSPEVETPDAALAETDDTLREWLRSINPALQKYSIGLRDYGYENVGLLRLSNQEDFAEGLRECNVQRPHIAPLMEAFRQLMEVEVEVEQDASDSEHQGAEAPSDDDEVEEVAPPRLCSGGASPSLDGEVQISIASGARDALELLV